MEDINSVILLITLKVNALNPLIKGENCHIVFKKARSNYVLSIGVTLQNQRHKYLKVKACNWTYHANSSHKRAKVAMLISNNIDFQIRNIARDREIYLIMIKGQYVRKI